MSKEQLDILVFGAHPDDAEIGMGGTIIKHTASGYKVGLCDLTYAEMSSNGTVEIRQMEAKAADSVLGVSFRSNLGLPDRGLSLTREHIDAITKEIRLRRPRIVFAPYWQDRHPDHVACSHLVQEAVFNAKLRNYMPELPPVQVEALFFYFINDSYESDLLIDISGHYKQKMKALSCYVSQFTPAGEGNDFVNTPLNQAYLDRVEARDRVLGQKAMVPYAEGFVTKVPYRINLF